MPSDRVNNARVSRRKNEHGEWVVRAYAGIKRVPESDYFTTDYDDAVATAKAMSSSKPCPINTTPEQARKRLDVLIDWYHKQRNS